MRTTTRLALLATFGSALTLSSCSTGGHSPSGFLSNYKQLDAGYGTANAVSSYVKPGVDFKKYDSVIIDPVTTVVAAKGISPAITDQLAAYLGGSLHSQLSGGYKIVNVAGPTTLRVRTNLTDVSKTPMEKTHWSPCTRILKLRCQVISDLLWLLNLFRVSRSKGRCSTPFLENVSRR